jgi:hypothetical protein
MTSCARPGTIHPVLAVHPRTAESSGQNPSDKIAEPIIVN